MVLPLYFLKRVYHLETHTEICKNEKVCKDVLQNNIAGGIGQ